MNAPPWRRISLFAAWQSLSGIAPLLALPAVIGVVGQSGWVSLSIGFGVGSAASVLVAAGWPISGPALIARADGQVRRDLHGESLLVQSTVWLLAGSLGALISSSLAPSHAHLAALMAVATASYGMSPGWYFVGSGEPRLIALVETLPRLLATLLAIPAVHVLDAPLWYAVLMLTGSLTGVALGTRLIQGRWTPALRTMPGWAPRLRANLLLAIASAVGSGYTNMVVPLMQLAGAPVSAMSHVAAATRLRALVAFGSTAIGSALQGWTAAPSNELERARNMRTAMWLMGLSALPLALVLTLMGPLGSRFLFGDVASLSWQLCLVAALALLPFGLGYCTSFHILAPSGHSRIIFRARLIASALGVPAVLVLTREAGAIGALTAMLVAECINTGYQMAASRRVLQAGLASRPDPTTRIVGTDAARSGPTSQV